MRPGTGQWEVVRPAVDPESLPDPSYLPVPESTTLTGPDGRDVHVHIYPPRNPDHTAPDGERPPYVVFVHGGPTAQSTPVALDLAKAFFTSRGIGVLDVNYGGSTGYGRAYRQRLDGAWGEVDVDDCVVAARALVERGDADPARLAIRGGSAGGWTTLCAVTTTDVFAAGYLSYGVADAGRAGRDHARLRVAVRGQPRRPRTVRPALRSTGPTRPAARCCFCRAPTTRWCRRTRPRRSATRWRPKASRTRWWSSRARRTVSGAAETIQAAAEAELSFYGQVMGFEPPGIPRLDLVR